MQQPAVNQYIPFIDGLRAVAVLAILLFHLDVRGFGGGFIGVDIFFVISGYLITGHIHSQIRAGTFSLREFYARRIKRIFPALFFMFFIFAVAALFFLGPSAYSEFFRAMRYGAIQASNFFFVKELDYFDHGQDLNPLLHTWSLAVEEQFYLFWPLLFLVWARFCARRGAHYLLLAICLVSLCISQYLVKTDTQMAFYMLHSRAWELGLGGLAALWPLSAGLDRKKASILSALALGGLLACVFLYDSANFPGVKAFFPCLAAAVLFYAARHHETIIHRILSVKGLTAVGLISYSLYLWHWPLIAFYKNYFAPSLSVTAMAGLGAASVLCAVISYFLVEKPVRYALVKRGVVFAVALLLAVGFVVGTNVLKREKEAPWRTVDGFDRAVSEPSPYFALCGHEGGAYDTANCIIGPKKDAYEVILAGDSHAAHYAPTVLGWAKERGLTVRLFFRGNCRSFVEMASMPVHNGKPDDYCKKMQSDFYRILNEQKSIRHVFLALYTPGDRDELYASLRKVRGTAQDVYYLGLVPGFKEDPLRCSIRHSLLATKIFPQATDGEKCVTIDADFNRANTAFIHDELQPELKKINIPYFDPAPLLTRPFDEKGNFLYMDDNHLNVFGGEYLVPHLGRFVQGQ